MCIKLLFILLGMGEVCVAQTMNAHPRIWMTPTILSTLQARQAIPTANWTTFKSWTDSIVYNAGGAGACNPSTPVIDDRGIIGPAMVYLILGDTGYGNCAKTLLLKKGADMCPVGVFGGNGTRGGPTCYSSLNDYRGQANIDAAVFDWIYPLLSAGDITTIVGRFRNAAVNFENGGGANSCPYPNGGAVGGGSAPCPYSLNTMLAYAGGNLQAGAISTTWLIGLATYGDNSTDNTTTKTNQETTQAISGTQPTPNRGLRAVTA